ncbi:unnamed protein product, partial [Choristocarpus tenellus]
RYILFVVNIQCPGNTPVSLVLTWLLDMEELGGGEGQGCSKGFMGLLQEYLNIPLGSDSPGGIRSSVEPDSEVEPAPWDGALPCNDYRNKRLKMFPRVAQGAWVVRKAVGSKPFLVGQKLTCRYFQGKGFMETDVDIGSSVVAYNATSLAMGYAKSLVVDLGFGIQGESEKELPECLIGSVRLNHLDLEASQPLYRAGQGSSAFACFPSPLSNDPGEERKTPWLDKDNEGVLVGGVGLEFKGGKGEGGGGQLTRPEL